MERKNPMTSTPPWDVAAVEQAVSQLTSVRPAYASIIGFYGPVFVAQVEAAGNASPEAIMLDDDLIAARLSKSQFDHLLDILPGGQIGSLGTPAIHPHLPAEMFLPFGGANAAIKLIGPIVEQHFDFRCRAERRSNFHWVQTIRP